MLNRLYDSINDQRKRSIASDIWACLNPNFIAAQQKYIIDLAAFNIEQMALHRAIITEWQANPGSVDSLTWFLPTVDKVTAGFHNIFNFVRFLCRKGVSSSIIIIGNQYAADQSVDIVRRALGSDCDKVTVLKNPCIQSIPYADGGVATMWHTAYALLKYNNTKSKFYFIQDDERLLYPAGLEHSLVEATYRMGFTGITNAECLKDMYAREFGGKAECYFPSPSKKTDRPVKKGGGIGRVFFYARPEAERNGLYLGLAGLREIQKRHPGIEIVTAGSKYKFNSGDLTISNMGNIPAEKLTQFYSSCDVGIYIILSKHTGVIPFELMACGCAVMTNHHHFPQSYLKHENNCMLFDLTPGSIADNFDIIFDNRKLYERLVSNGLEFIAEMPSLAGEMERVFKFMTS